MASGRKSRNKGATFERKIAKELGAWWGAQFHRTPQSGGSQLKEGFGLAGDVVTDSQDFPFHIECKKQEGWDLSQLLTGKTLGAIGSWVEQTLRDCPTAKVPLLVFAKNLHPVLYAVCIRHENDADFAGWLRSQSTIALLFKRENTTLSIGVFDALLTLDKEEIKRCLSTSMSAQTAASASSAPTSSTKSPKKSKPRKKKKRSAAQTIVLEDF